MIDVSKLRVGDLIAVDCWRHPSWNNELAARGLAVFMGTSSVWVDALAFYTSAGLFRDSREVCVSVKEGTFGWDAIIGTGHLLWSPRLREARTR